MDRVFDPNAWSMITKALFGLGGSSSSSSSETLLLPKEKEEILYNLEQISEHVFELSKKPERLSAEIIFFHGLQLDSSSKPNFTTWLSKDGSQLWLNWLLEEFPDVRILVVSYDASIVKTDKDGRLDMYLTCENLVQELMGRRKTSVGETGCPIILVGHCLGGLVLKELCVEVGRRTMIEADDCCKKFFRSVKGVFCYSSPHHGSELPDCKTSRARGSLFEDFNPLNAKTARRNEHFGNLRKKEKWKTAGVGENLEVTLSNFKGLIVSEASSRHDMDKYYTISDADHFGVCRPDSKISASYTMLANLIDQVIKEDKGSMVSISDLPDPLVGFDSRIQTIEDKLCTESRIALVGMGGIGKSTLARAVYERIQNSFEYACFYREVKKWVGKNDTAQELRDKMRTLFVDRGGRKVHETFSWNMLEGKKVLIVLDDSISKEQVKVMTSEDGFSTGSRLIITARDKGFIKRANMGFYIHSVEELDFDSSKELFCRCAFGAKESPVGFSEHVQKIVMKCDGLPLALTVTGGFLFHKRKPEWENAFKRLQAAESLTGDAQDDLWSLLMVSYESLAVKEKEMFLDAATCFHGKRLEEVLEIWKFCDCADPIGWDNLLAKHLVKAHGNGMGYSHVRVSVHEVLRDLGRSIAGRSRMLVQDLNEVSNEEAKVVKVVSGHVDDCDESLLCKFSKLKVLWLDCESSRVRSGESNEGDDGNDSDEGDDSDESNDSDGSDEKHGDNQGQWMEPVSSALTEMLVVQVSGIKDVAILRRIFTMKSLLFLKFDSLKEESNFPDLVWSKIGNLEKLQALRIEQCPVLRQLPAEINKLQSLQSLYIHDCSRLEALPTKIGRLKKLHYLKISWCRSLEAIPASIGRLKNLKSLDISQCSNFKVIPAEIGQLKNVRSLVISAAPKLEPIPAEIGQLKNLQSLYISGCSNLKTIPAEIGHLKNLQELHIDEWSNLKAIPTEIGHLKNLQSLAMNQCSSLEAIPTEIGQLENLESLAISGGPNFEAIPPEIGQLKNLQWLWISKAGLKGIPTEIGQLKKLRWLQICWCLNLEVIPAEIGQLENLQTLYICGSNSLKAIPAEVGQLKNLQSFTIYGCPSLKAVPAEIDHLNLEQRWIHL